MAKEQQTKIMSTARTALAARKGGPCKKKVLVFGTFDGIHAGHLFFLSNASKFGDLYISIASDESIKKRKTNTCLNNENIRLNEVKKLKIAKSVSIGDKILGKWSDVKNIRPDIVVIGYDQTELKNELKKIQKLFNFDIRTIKSFMPKKLHSSIINKEKNCLFCSSPEIKDRMIMENKLAWCFPTNIPIVPGHVLISPKRCVKNFEKMTSNEQKAVFSLMTTIKEALKRTFKADGFNVAWNEGTLAGQSVPHFHLHILPRKEGDSGITRYEPRKFLYRPGSHEASPEKELQKVAKLISKNI